MTTIGVYVNEKRIGETAMPVATMQALKRNGYSFRQTRSDIEINDGDEGEIKNLLNLYLE